MTMVEPRSVTSGSKAPKNTSLRPETTHFEARLGKDGRGGALSRMLARPMTDFWLILGSATLLVALGCLMVLSASSVWASHTTGQPYYYVIRQLVFLGAGIPAAWLISRLSPSGLRYFGWIALPVSVLLLMAVFTPLGVEQYGNRAWLSLGGLGTIQPSEFAKLALIVWSAAVFATLGKKLEETRHLLIPFLPVFMIVLGLVLLQHDLGTAVVLGTIMFAMLWLVGASWKILGGLGLGGVAVVVGMIITDPERMGRMFSFFGDNPGSSDQPLNAIYALASGGWWGVGLGASRQKWGGLYNGAQTDYVFAVLGEEMGVFGTLMVIGLFAILIFAGLRTALHSTDPLMRYAAGGVTAWIGLQAIFNIAVVLRLMPVFGVPLPFLSQGGSALLSNLLGVGVLLAAARNEPEARAAKESKGGAARPRLTSVVDAVR